MAVGLAPINFDNKSSESALSIYPIAIGNCKEKRLVALKLGTMINEPIRNLLSNSFHYSCPHIFFVCMCLLKTITHYCMNYLLFEFLFLIYHS